MPMRPSFDLDRLVDYSDESICAEIRRVAASEPNGVLTKRLFDVRSRVSASTVCKRFGNWRAALERAGLSDRYSGKTVSGKMLSQSARSMSDEEVIAEIQRVASHLGKTAYTYEEFNDHSSISYSTVLSRFGSWRTAVERAGLSVSNHGRRYTDDECFENLLSVWTHFGRIPQYREMGLAPSCVGGKAYIKRWGTWNRALAAFVERANSEAPEAPPTSDLRISEQQSEGSVRVVAVPEAERREVRLGLRYRILKRDGFRCVVCGRSPAVTPGLELHVDHIDPFSAGGKTVAENLRTTCSDCNLGKGASRNEP